VKSLTELEATMAAMDAEVTACVEARNQLEGFVLNVNSELEYSLRAFATEAEVNEVGPALKEMEYWLEEQEDEEIGWENARKQYEEQLSAAKILAGPILQRKEAADAREAAAEELEVLLSELKGKAENVTLDGGSSSAAASAAAPAAATGLVCAVCAVAAAEGKKLLRCTLCYSVFYCGKECQKKAWKAHKKECKKHEGTPPPYPMPEKTEEEAKPSEEEAKEEEETPPSENETSRLALLSAVTAAEEWLAGVKKQQASVAVGGEDAFTVEEITSKTSALREQAKPVLALIATGGVKKEVEKETKEVEIDADALQIEMAP
jgi:hypothetical protein